MLRLRTTTLPAKDLLRPSTSMAIAAPLSFLRSFLRMADAWRGPEADRHRLADPQVLRLGRPRFDAEHQAGTLFAAVDDRRRKLGLRRDEADAGGEARCAAVAADVDCIVDVQAGQRRLRHEKAHLGVVRRQQGDDRPPRLHQFADAEIDLLY